MKNNNKTPRTEHFFYNQKAKEIRGDVFTQYYDDEQNGIRQRHIFNYEDASNSFDSVRDRLEELEKKISPYFEETKLNSLPEEYIPLKIPLYHYISQIKYGIFALDDYSVELKPQDDDPKTIEKVEKLDLVLRTELLKANANRSIKEALLTSRRSFYGGTLITWKNPAEYGQEDNPSFTPFSITNINPKAIRWDPNYDSIEKMDFVYILSATRWYDIINHPILGANKELISAIERELFRGDHDPETISSSVIDPENDSIFQYSAADKSDSFDRNRSTIVLKTKFWIKNKNTADQKCMISYFIGEDILLNTHEAGCSIIPISMLYEFKTPGDFYGTNTIYNLNSLISNYEALLQAEYNNALRNSSRLLLMSKSLGVDFDQLNEDMKNKPLVIQQTKEDSLLNNGVMQLEGSSVSNDGLPFLENQKEFIFQMAGIDRIVLGETNSLQTAQGVAGVLQEARLLDESCIGYLQDYIMRFNTIALEYITKKYNGLKNGAKIRIQKPDLEIDEQGVDYEFIKVDKGDFHNLKVDIIPSFNATSALNRTQSLSTLLQLITLDAQRQQEAKIFPDNSAILDALKDFLPNYKWMKLALSRANSTKWNQFGEAATNNVLNGLINQVPLSQINQDNAAAASTLARGGGFGDIPINEEPEVPEEQELPGEQEALLAQQQDISPLEQ